MSAPSNVSSADLVTRALARVESVTPLEAARWLDRADDYAYMAGLYGQLAVVAPRQDLVVVVTAHIPAAVDASSVTRWLVERYVLPAVRD